LKTFIREGQKKAEVTLHLTNRGEEAFQPEIYGDEIIIQRNISKDGSSGFKIKSSRDHRVVSSRRDGLQTILDHFMIQADNPLNVLNQDAAKKFLNSSSSKQKYDVRLFSFKLLFTLPLSNIFLFLQHSVFYSRYST
jgi:chromosome segregation ATPase